MTPALSEDLLEVNDARKTAVNNSELQQWLQIDIIALQETRLHVTGSIWEKDFTFFWQGKPPEEVREHGIGFTVRNRLLGSIVPTTVGSARIIKLQFHKAAGLVGLINAYAPTLTSSTKAKDKSYDDLGLTLRDIPPQEPGFLLGDLQARVGSDHSSWPSCLGKFGFGKMKENGQRLLEFCCHDLCVTNSFSDTKPQHKVSWRHPKPKHWHQLYHWHQLTRRSNLRSVKLTRSFQSADWKAPGDEGIPPEVLKCARGTLKTELHEHLRQCWRDVSVPQDLRDANIIILHKNKSDKSDYNNYRGISLLSVVGKRFVRVVLAKLQILAERVYPESQCGFRAERSTTDMVFSLRQLQEKCRK
ncbi:craniofacial development protein 2-like [Procambarus clarkii]|uniref:craniofacial development protein 2-like n=1 Tax=Procambarus clarkii TaxID=6728 RepID=UPI0037434DD6